MNTKRCQGNEHFIELWHFKWLFTSFFFFLYLWISLLSFTFGPDLPRWVFFSLKTEIIIYNERLMKSFFLCSASYNGSLDLFLVLWELLIRMKVFIEDDFRHFSKPKLFSYWNYKSDQKDLHSFFELTRDHRQQSQ